MIVKIVKTIVSIFLLVVAIFLFFLWLICGTIFLIAMLIRLISLYTIALLNSFVSGNPLTQDYTAAIEEIIDMYLNTYAKIISMPKLPWLDLQNKRSDSLRALLPAEMAELKKSWAITIIVFASYILSFGSSLALLVYKQDNKLKAKYEMKLENVNKNNKELKQLNNKYEFIISENEQKKIRAVEFLYTEKKYSINSIAEFLDSTPKDIEKIIKANNISR